MLRTYIRFALGGLAALALILGGLAAYIATDHTPTNGPPAIPLPPVSEHLGPNWLTPTPTPDH
ncbi:hypothetical protein [Nocardia sp. CDC160]|uniref:hypothetical protein n=1 Tax=Nocardia sp. CDC160 TaxID=3112166 RepID=UPI002DBB3235|nr:hypothetical protein [Nocardia sp. CDC160]MEC3913203.1 hypothetical protein [Nocardia sp. CDC160]